MAPGEGRLIACDAKMSSFNGCREDLTKLGRPSRLALAVEYISKCLGVIIDARSDSS